MSQPWKLLPLAAIVAVLGALLLAPGGATQPNSASAEFTDCPSDQGTLIIEIVDDDTNDPITVEGSRVEISPDPVDAAGARDYVDGGADDGDDDPGVITVINACADDGNAPTGEYTATLESLPGALADCDDVDLSDTDFAPEDGESQSLTLVVDCSDVDPTATPTTSVTVTPTGTITGTPGAAATVTTSASPGTISCSGTSIVTIQVRDADGDPVPAGTAVTIATTLGSVSPTSGQTTDASGNAFVFLTAPANQGGTATVTAESGSAEGSTTVTINCGAAATATSAPPATVAPGGGGVISPPNTGDAGLAEAGTQGWIAFAGVAFLLAATVGAVGIVRARA
jgi:hypothetical protein